MNKGFKKALCVFLAVLMAVSSVPFSGLADLELPKLFGGVTASAASKKVTGKIRNKCGAGANPWFAETAGLDNDCGDNLIWELDLDTGVMTISGVGAMSDMWLFVGSLTPWKDYNDYITSIRIEPGVTYIGSGAFWACQNVKSFFIPSSVKSIGSNVFTGGNVDFGWHYKYSGCVIYYEGNRSQYKTVGLPTGRLDIRPLYNYNLGNYGSEIRNYSKGEVVVKALNKNNELVPLSGATVFVDRAKGNNSVRLYTLKTDSKGVCKLPNVLEKINNPESVTVSAEYETGDYILHSEKGYASLAEILDTDVVFILDRYCKKYDISTAFLSSTKDDSIKMTEGFRKAFWDMTSGGCIISNISYESVSDKWDLNFNPADIRITDKEKLIGANVGRYDSLIPGHIYMGIESEAQGNGSPNVMAHEAGHYFFGFYDEYCYGKGYKFDANGNGFIDSPYYAFYSEIDCSPIGAIKFYNVPSYSNLKCTVLYDWFDGDDEANDPAHYYGDLNRDGIVDGNYYYLPIKYSISDQLIDDWIAHNKDKFIEAKNVTYNLICAYTQNKVIFLNNNSHVDEKNSGYWTSKPSGSRGNVYRPIDSPRSFGIMESDYTTTALSTKDSYNYLLALAGSYAVDHSHPEYYPEQYFRKGKSCQDQLDEMLENAVAACPYNAIPHASTVPPSYRDNVLCFSGDINELYETLPTADIHGDSVAYRYAKKLALKIARFNLLGSKVIITDWPLLRTKSASSEIQLFVQAQNDPSNIYEKTLDFKDGSASVELGDIGSSCVLTLTKKNDDETYSKNTYTISSFDSEISDGTWYSDMADISADIESTNGVANDLLILSDELEYVNGDYKSVDGAITLIKTDENAEISGKLIKTIPLNSGLDLSTIGVFKYENDEYTRISQGFSDGEKAFAYVTFPYDGEGTYVLMAKPASTEAADAVTELSVEETENTGIYTVSFKDDYEFFDVAAYNIYYSKSPITDTEDEGVLRSTVRPYSKSCTINLNDDYGTWYFAVETVMQDGAKSELSECVQIDFEPIDSDNDGIPDYWIDKYPQLVGVEKVAEVDSDRDGLNNLQEFLHGTNPLSPDTDCDNVYDGIEVEMNLDPLAEKTDGINDDYIVLYGQPDLRVNRAAIENGKLAFEVENLAKGKALRTTVTLDVNGETVACWCDNIGSFDSCLYEYEAESIDDISSVHISVDESQSTRDIDYSNNTFDYVPATSIEFSAESYNITKGTAFRPQLITEPENAGEIYSWSITGSELLKLNTISGKVTSYGIGRATLTATTKNGLTASCEIYGVGFDGAEYSEFDSELINGGNGVEITDYVGSDTEIVIPEKLGGIPVTRIASLGENSGVTSVLIPALVDSVSATAFNGLSALEAIAVDGESTCFTSENGILYSFDKSTLVRCPIAYGAEAVTVSSGTNKASAYAFANCKNLSSVDLGDVTDIENNAFFGTGLTAVTVPEGVTHIGKNAFRDCGELKTLYYNAINCVLDCGSEPTSGSEVPFGPDIENIFIGDSVKRIPDHAFIKTKTSEIDIPDSVEAIGNGAFYACTSLARVGFTENSKLKSISSFAFHGDSALSDISIPAPVESIGNYAFYNCSALPEIALPDGLIRIEDHTFSGCSSLKSVELPDTVKVLASCAFQHCGQLMSIRLPKSLTELGEYALGGCTELSSVEMPEGLTSIARYAFEDCAALSSIDLPEALTYIGKNAFSGCSALTEINIPERVTAIPEYTFDGCLSLARVTLPDSIKTVGIYAFRGCAALTEIDMPVEVTVLNEGLFDGCSSLEGATLPENLTRINKYAFRGCESLTDIYIPEKITVIDNSAFEGCASLKTVCIDDKSIEIKVAEYNSHYYAIFNNGVQWNDAEKLCEAYGGHLATVTDPEEQEFVGGLVGKFGSACWLGGNDTETEGTFTWVTGEEWDYTNWHTGEPNNDRNSQDYVEMYSHGKWDDNYNDAYCAFVCEWESADAFTTEKFTVDADNCDGNSLTLIKSDAFSGCDSITDVYYSGDADDLSSLVIEETNNTALLNAEYHLGHTHNVTDWVIKKAVGCLSYGVKRGICTECGCIIKKTIPATGHSMVAVKVVEPTCTEGGHTEYECAYCGLTGIGDYTQALGHDYSSVVTDPTCTEGGYTEYECERCGDTYIGDYTQALGHDYSSIVTDPTCITDGYTTHTCSRCGDIYTDKTVPATGHSFGKWLIRKRPTLNESGTEYRICKICGFEDTRTTSPINASDFEYKVNDDGVTCTITGITVSLSHVYVPEKIGEYNVSGIKRGALTSESIKLVHVPATVTDIGDSSINHDATVYGEYGSAAEMYYFKGFVTSFNPHTCVFGDDDFCIYCSEYRFKDNYPISSKGVCGDNLKYRYYYGDPSNFACPTRLLVIFGDGEMYDYPAEIKNSPDHFSNAENIIIREGCTKIGTRAFASGKAVKVKMADTVTQIGSQAFYYCSDMTDIRLSQGLEKLGYDALNYCFSLESIFLPAALSSVQLYGRILDVCPSLKRIDVDEANTIFSSIDGILFNKDKTALIQMPESYEVTDYSVPETVTTIDSSAFYGNKNVNRISIPDSVDYIGPSAFCGCINLQQVNLPASMTYILNSTFCDCRSLTRISIPEGVLSVSSSAFYNCTSLQSIYIPSSVESIAARSVGYIRGADGEPTVSDELAIYGHNGSVAQKYAKENGIIFDALICEHTPDNYIHKNRTEPTCTQEGYTSGVYCNVCKEWIKGHEPITASHTDSNTDNICDVCGAKLTVLGENITWTLENGILCITGSGAMYDFIEPVFMGTEYNGIIKEIIVENGVTSIGANAFAMMPALERVTLASSVRTIGDRAFQMCPKLESINIPVNVKKIPASAFAYCVSLESISLPKGLTSIDEGAFSFCISLTSVEIPQRVKTVGTGAYRACLALESVTVNASSVTIGEACFIDCPSLKTVTVDSTDVRLGEMCIGYSELALNAPLEDIKELYVEYAVKLCSGTLTEEEDAEMTAAFDSMLATPEEGFVKNDELVINGYNDTAVKAYAQACGLTFSSLSEEPHEHSFTVITVTKEATCTESGTARYACECGEAYTQEIPATGHTPGEALYETEHPHREYKLCAACGEALYTGNVGKVDGCEECVATVIAGDANGDGVISMLDTVLISRYIVDGCKYDPTGYAITLNEKAADVNAADVNADGVISMLDTVLISRYIVDGCKTDPEGYNITLIMAE